MIQPLRKTHRLIFIALAVLLPMLLIAALIVRQPMPVNPPFPFALAENEMSQQYRAISWNPQKRRYDAVMATGLALYLALVIGVSVFANPNATIETLLIRAFGTVALLLLHVVLFIEPLCRLQPRFLPLLYNVRSSLTNVASAVSMNCCTAFMM